MKINVVGVVKVDYVNKSGRQISGVQLFAIAPSGGDNVKGQIWIGKRNGFNYSPIFCSSTIIDPDKVSVGAYDIQFDISGNVSTLEKIKVE